MDKKTKEKMKQGFVPYSIRIGDRSFSFKTPKAFSNKLKAVMEDLKTSTPALKRRTTGQTMRTPSRRMKASDAKIFSKAMKNASNRTYRNVLKIKKSK